MIIILIEPAMITPPVGINLYVVQGLRKRGRIDDVIIGASPFVITMMIMVVILSIWPEIALWLPKLAANSAKFAPRRLHRPAEGLMPEFDLAIRGGTIVTASDEFRADIGIRDGRIVALADKSRARARDRRPGLLALPGGIDSHVHIAQPSGPDVVLADDFASGTAAAAAGGNTCVLPFALQIKGTSLRACVEEYAASRRRGMLHRHRLSSHHLRPDGGRARPGAAGARQGRLHLLQGLHDL